MKWQIREQEGNEKSIPTNREGNEKKNISDIRERKGNEKIHSHILRMGIRGFHSREWTGTGILAHPCQEFNKKQGIRDTSFINCFHSIAPFKHDVFISIHSANKDFDFFRLITSL